MRRLACLLVVAALSAGAASAQGLFFSPDVPTDPGVGIDQLPWDIFRHGGGLYTAVPSFTAPGKPAVNAIHKMDRPDSWLFSLEAPSDLAANLPQPAQPRDVIRYDGAAGSYDLHMCGGSIVTPIPLKSNIDALYAEAATGADRGDLIVSFDTPTQIGADLFEPADLVRFKPTVNNPTCSDWQVVGPVFDASMVGVTVPKYGNLIGADEAAGRLIMSFDVPVDLAPSLGPTTYLPGQVVSWDGASFSIFDILTTWPIKSQVDALSCLANPGRIPLNVNQLLLNKVGGMLAMSWPAGCSDGSQDYSIYTGTIPNYYTHTMDVCSTAGNTNHLMAMPGGSSYFLIVPHNDKEEGSYGLANFGGVPAERPQPIPLNRCNVEQVVTLCP